MPPLGSRDDLTPEQKATLQKVTDRFNASEKLHRQLVDRWNVWYGLSRNWRRLQRSHAQSNTPNDKDTVVQEYRRVFGEELFIPYCFTVIETNVPRIIATSPKIKCLPNDEKKATQEACKPVERLYERDDAAIQYELKLQEVVRSGLRYGLGVGKNYWEKKTRNGKKSVPRLLGTGRKVVDNKIVVYEGPQFEGVDIFDFFWDPAAKNLECCSYVIHRTWRDMEYIKRKVATKEWAELDLEKVQGMGSTTGRGEVWAERMMAAGMTNYQTEGNSLHEVWECHDRENVYTILDRALVVQEDSNPFHHGDYPFQIYRPTLVEHEFCGIGEVEPIAHLQYELNQMRGQRRDAATLALNRGYFYQVGTLDPSKIVTGAGVFNPVFGNPSEIIQPMPFTDIPQSGVSEEEALKADIELASAISESVVGSGGESTATGTQLVQAAANLRIKQKGKNLHAEVLVPGTAQRHALYQQYVTSNTTMRVESDHAPTGVPDDERTPTGFSFVECGPKEINANIEIVPIDGSTEPDDPAQKRSNAESLAIALAPFAEVLDAPELVKYVLEQFGIEKPDGWIKQMAPEGAGGPDPLQLVQNLGHILIEHGVDPKLVGAAIQEAAQHHAQTEEQPSEAPAAPNGAAPQPEPVGA